MTGMKDEGEGFLGGDGEREREKPQAERTGISGSLRTTESLTATIT